MIVRIRKVIAYTLSVVLVVISVGFLKPNFTGEATVSETSKNNGVTISKKLS